MKACLTAKITTAEVVHIDASLIRANVSWDSLVERHVGDVLSENQAEEAIGHEKQGRQSGKYKKVCTTVDRPESLTETVRLLGCAHFPAGSRVIDAALHIFQVKIEETA